VGAFRIKMGMKIIGIIIILFLPSCQPSDSRLEEFNAHFNSDQAMLLDEWVIAYQEFMRENTPWPKLNQGEMNFLFLNDPKSWQTDQNFKIDSARFSDLIARSEESGLRKEVFLFGYETKTQSPLQSKYIHDLIADSLRWLQLDSIPILDPETVIPQYTQVEVNELLNASRTTSKYPYCNLNGQYLKALKEQKEAWEIWEKYYLLNAESNNVSPGVFYGGLRSHCDEQSIQDPIIQRILVTEYFYRMILESMPSKQHST